MRHAIRKSAIVLSLCAGALVTGGCLDSGGSSEGAAPPPPPGGNNAPVIAGTPPAIVVVGNNYSFTPTATDADGDDLTFSIDNLPEWAEFNPATGALTGMAVLGAEGTYSNIQISVSDGSQTVSLPPFSILVTQVAGGTAVLSWTPPTQNQDGSNLDDLTGYKIYYGTSPGSYSNLVVVDNPGLSSFVIENLAPNTYYFVATAVNSQGIESGFSNVATKEVL